MDSRAKGSHNDSVFGQMAIVHGVHKARYVMQEEWLLVIIRLSKEPRRKDKKSGFFEKNRDN